jgi:hypothetical protein
VKFLENKKAEKQQMKVARKQRMSENNPSIKAHAQSHMWLG